MPLPVALALFSSSAGPVHRQSIYLRPACCSRSARPGSGCHPSEAMRPGHERARPWHTSMTARQAQTRATGWPPGLRPKETNTCYRLTSADFTPFPTGAASSKPTTQPKTTITAPAAVPGGANEFPGPVRCGGTRPGGACPLPARQSMQLQPDEGAAHSLHHPGTAPRFLVVCGEYAG